MQAHLGPVKSVLKNVLPEPVVMRLQAVDHYFNGEPELRLLKNVVPRGRTAIDAGANIGIYSYFLRTYASTVYAYEPNPDLADRLTRLLPTVRVRPVALSDAKRELVLRVPIEAGRVSHELGSVCQTFDEETRDFRVACVTVDSENLPDVGFIKIDVEQHEREVLRGALGTIRRCRPVLMVEVYPLKYRVSLPEEFAFLTAEGFCPWFRFAGKWHPFREFEQQTHARAENFGNPDRFVANNVLFFPGEHLLAPVGPQGLRSAQRAPRH
jgi:FkbM family methyltransferase